MTQTLTLRRGGTSVTVPLREESGEILSAVDIGKDVNIATNGRPDPIFQDRQSWQENYVFAGRFQGANAYERANTLADLIKAGPKQSDSDAVLRMDTDSNRFPSDVPVVPGAGQDGALTLTYPAGYTREVAVDLTLTRVSRILGGTAYESEPQTPTASGSGPITFTGPSGTGVAMGTDLEVQRSVGRPNDTIDSTTVDNRPRATVQTRSAADTFSLRFEYGPNEINNLGALTSILQQKYGQTPATLDFNGVYGLGSFDVVPTGSQAGRHVSEAGFRDTAPVPQLSLRVVDQP